VARPEGTAGPPAKREPPVSAENYYASSLTEGERVELPKAEQVENLGDEIAALRVRLKTALKDRPEDYALLVRGIGMLTRAVAMQYRLSPRASKDLSDNLAAVLNRFGDLIVPADR
jgi:hypothetical protein